ncbi:MAG: aminotransferase class I/II-fold pyridoxal phosphate-dependent enzyme [Lachnospiraceae bacterium]|nr:aminotransferase class I/II-fold pyridoxal phosphate-dependent enzyme [Lachnospiraceae bacterium]
MADLYQKLEEYAHTDYYPYHMPGHKRHLYGNVLAQTACWDITEIDGFDNLHAPEGILKSVQEKAAAIYGAKESFFLVNGSTAGILSAVSATVEQGGKILITRGCHKAVYHAAYLRNLEIKYLYPGQHEEFGCNLAVTALQVEQALKEDSDIQAVCIVSPTYEGLVADVEEIAKVVHKRGIPLIVDEAHGAHLGFHPAWPESSVRRGADIVIQSLHKTLPAPTQTAILHVNGSLIDRRELKKFLSIYQSSSPSYLFMAAMEEAVEIASNRATELFGSFLANWTEMCDKLQNCRYIHFLKEPGMDIGKLVIRDKSHTFSGQQLYDILLEKYHLQMEMAAGGYVLAMFTIGDTKEGYERLTEALLQIDAECGGEQISGQTNEKMKTLPQVKYKLCESWRKDTKEILLKEAAGYVAGEFVNLYPPGVPLIVPGEIFTEELCVYLEDCISKGLNVQGITERGSDIFVSCIARK